MSREHKLPPSAASLSASMRDIGYSLGSAVADLIDNSISAGATDINIYCTAAESTPVLAIVDNGHGMDADELINAMRHGVVDPRQQRTPEDLGRFGLGLKTASFSQCRRLTVLSAKNNVRNAAEWNLDLVDERDDWIISILDPEEINDLPYVNHLGSDGTVVIWRSLDRLFENETGERRDEIINEKLAIVERHLALVFHRFLSGGVKGYKKLSIRINGHALEAFDPFCRANTNTQMMPEEIVRIGDASVHMQPFILPHHSRLSASEYDFYQSRSDFISNQGAYIYRNGRLMAWADWFRLIPKGEATKLARVQIDFPSYLDEDWTIDIKKSRARPPHIIRERLRQIISKIISRSVTVHRGRGQKLFQDTDEPFWERYADHNGIRYVINEQHPIIASLEEKMSEEDANDLSILLDSVSASLPVEMIYSDYATNPREIIQKSVDESQSTERLQKLWQMFYMDVKRDEQSFLEIVRSTHLFDNQMELVENFVREKLA